MIITLVWLDFNHGLLEHIKKFVWANDLRWAQFSIHYFWKNPVHYYKSWGLHHGPIRWLPFLKDWIHLVGIALWSPWITSFSQFSAWIELSHESFKICFFPLRHSCQVHKNENTLFSKNISKFSKLVSLNMITLLWMKYTYYHVPVFA
jgi:hypothetical protein